jgi:hypothetical protein
LFTGCDKKKTESASGSEQQPPPNATHSNTQTGEISAEDFLQKRKSMISLAESHFSKYMTTSSQTLKFLDSLPTLSDCEAILKYREDARKVYEYCKENKERYSSVSNHTEYRSCLVEVAMKGTDDLILGDAGRMRNDLSEKLKPGVPFFVVLYYTDAGITRTSGGDPPSPSMHYAFFVYRNGRFVFFPKIQRAFR